MKKKQIKGKLSFDKLTIAKLSNTAAIRGGSEYCNQTISPEHTGTCMPSDVLGCTLTGIGPTTTGTRPTQEQTKCNCDVGLL